MVVYMVYVGCWVYGMSYTWEGAYKMCWALPLGTGYIEEWNVET